MFEDWTQVYRWILLNALGGELRNSREGQTKDAGPFNLKIGRPPFVLMPGRGGSLEFARAEQLCYLSGSNSGPLVKYAPSYERFAENKMSSEPTDWYWPGAYGPRLMAGLLEVVARLGTYPDTRQAVVPIYNSEDFYRAGTSSGLDIPCTLDLVYWQADKKVNCHAIMRSSDVWFGTYYDLPAFYFLQCRVAEALRLQPGILWFTTSSLHIYAKHWKRAEELIHSDMLDPAVEYLHLDPEAQFLKGVPTSIAMASPVDRFAAMQGIASTELVSQEEVTLSR